MDVASNATLVTPGVPFYGRAHFYFALAFTVIIAGFWPSFFRKLGVTDAGHMIHGGSATIWMIVPIVQAWLISCRNFKWHRRLGRLALPLAPIVVISGLHMVQVMILDKPGIAEPLRSKLVFLDSSSMLFFVLLLGLALKNIYQRNIKAHAQYMACTVLVVLEPGLERLLVSSAPGIDNFTVGLNVALYLMEAITIALITFQWRTDRVRLPYVITLAFFVSVHILLETVSGSTMFHSVAHWFAHI